MPRTLSVAMPDHLKQGIAEWLSATHGTGAGLEVSAVLLRPPRAPDTTPDLPPEPERCAFLSLPPEMRNRIYRFALVETGDISIPATGSLPAEPGFLSTCTQIRGEASGIYYKQNNFVFTVHNHNAEQFIEWCRSSKRRLRAKQSFCINKSTNWPNLVHWLECYYHGHCPGAEPLKDRSLNPVVPYMCSVVEQLRVQSSLSWLQVEAILQNVRMGLGTQEAEWLDDSSS